MNGYVVITGKRGNISVFTKKVVPTDTESAEGINAKVEAA